MSKKRRKLSKKGILTIFVVILVFVEIIGGISGLVVLNSMLKDKPDLEMTNIVSKESSKIYDKDGNVIADVGTQIRTNVKYTDIPESLVDAFVAVEDSRYFSHPGFDSARFAKAMLENVKAMRFAQGGSTMTMQLIKLSYFTDDEQGINAPKKIKRKVQEIALALDLEKKTNKKDIFELYLNKMNYGGEGGIRGIQKAAQYYFGKNVNELSTPESAMIAGIINRPYAYNPYMDLKLATYRRNIVLNLMERHGYISKKEAQLYKSINVEDLLGKVENNGEENDYYQYQSYIDTAINEARELTGRDPFTIPMDIYTYMDPKIQKVMDSIQSGKEEKIAFPDDLMEVAMISINNKTGEIVGIGGGRNYGKGGSMLLNHAIDQYKQPGSSVKPMLDYALAFEHLGWSTSHVVTDKPIVYAGTNKIIKNFSGTYQGEVTLDYAIQNSLNTPAIQTLQDYISSTDNGRAKAAQYLMDLGFSKVTMENFDIGFAIGGSNFLASAKELVAAQATMLNEGIYNTPHTIQKVILRNDSSEFVTKVETRQVLSPAAAYLVCNLLQKVVESPYFNYMQVLKKPYVVYGKTGTSDWGSSGLQYNIPQGAAKDKWMLASTSDYTTAVWIGYEKGVKDANTYFDNAKSRLNLPGNISLLILSALNDQNNPSPVKRPEGVSTITHILGTFPYASPIQDMDPNFVTTGYIKNEFNKLVDPMQQDIKELASFNASVNNDGTINFTWAPYPEPDKLTVAPDTFDIGSDVGIEAWGKRIFDYTWIYGPIRYKARITNNSKTQEISSETENSSQKLEIPTGESEVCGFYAYENLGKTSNEVCVKIKINETDITIKVPGINASEQDIINWANQYTLNLNITHEINNDKANTNVIKQNNKEVNDKEISVKQSELSNLKFDVIIYEKQKEEPPVENNEASNP